MPIPKPETGESRNDFVSRCMADPTMVDEYDEDQRTAICSSQWDDSRKELRKMEKKSFPIEVKEVKEEGVFEGYLSVYDEVDLGGDVVRPKAFDKTIKENKGQFPLLWMHNQGEPIGSIQVESDDKGLKVSGKLVLEAQRANEAYAFLKAGVIRGLSIGYKAVKTKMVDGIRNLLEIKLNEGSLVLFPMLPTAQVTSVKDKKDGEKAETFDETLERLNLQGMRSKMFWALGENLDQIFWDFEDEGLTMEDKISAIDASIQQFHATYLEMLPRVLEVYGMTDAPAVKKLSDVQKQKISEIIGNLKNVLDEAENTFIEAEDTSTKVEAVNTSEKAVNTSEDEKAIQALKNALKKFDERKKENE